MPTGPDVEPTELAPMAITTARRKLLAWTAVVSIHATPSAGRTLPVE
jgi:hypothetical protein